MTEVFELYGEIASEITGTEDGSLLLWLESGSGLAAIYVPRSLGSQVRHLTPGDRLGVEVERSRGDLVAVEIRPSYVRGFPRWS